MAGLVSLLRLLLSPSYARDRVKASHACQNHGKLLPNYCKFIIAKRSQPRPFPASIYQDYSDVSPVCWNSSPTVCSAAGVNFRQCVKKAPQKQQPKEKPMKQRYFPVLIGAGLLVSGSIISGLANADMDDASHKRDKFMAKKLDINNDGMISLEALTSRQNKRFQMLDLNADGMIDKTEFNGRIVAMFEKMDSNGDGNLDEKEIRKMKRHNSGQM
jgi:hypothetical protein